MIKKFIRFIKGFIRWGITLFLIGMITRLAYYFFGNDVALKVLLILLLIFVVPFILAFLLRCFTNYVKKRKYLRSGLAEVDEMDGIQFENFLAAHFQKQGYKVSTTKTSGDFGADLVLEKKDRCIVVQAKRYSGKVGVKAVQEIISAMQYYEADKAMVVTNSYFTRNAIALADKTGVELWDRECLEKFLL